MALTVNPSYAGPKQGIFFKVMIETPDRLLSSYVKHPYPPRGHLPLIKRCDCVDASGYHVFVRAQQAAEVAKRYGERLYAFRAEEQHLVAAGTWNSALFNEREAAIFQTLDNLGPVTANIE